MNIKERLKKAATKKVVGVLIGAAVLTITGIQLPDAALDGIAIAITSLFGG